MERKNSAAYRCYIERDILWFWKIKASFGRIITAAPKGFNTREEAIDDLNRLASSVQEAYEKERMIS